MALICEKPQFAGKNGGGGNRTRVGFSFETLPLQELRWATEEAWYREQDFVDLLADRACDARSKLCHGNETSLYAVADDQAVKLGVARNPYQRADGLQVGTSHNLVLYCAVPATVNLEKWLHKQLGQFRVRGEWFRLDPPVLAVMEVLLSVAQMCVGIEEHVGPATVEDAVSMIADDLRREHEHQLGRNSLWLERAA